MPRPFYGGGIKTTALSVKYHIKNDITNIKMPLRWPFSLLNNFISIWHRIICNSNSKCSTLHHQLSSLFVTDAVFGLRESTLLNTITVKISVLLGCQHGVYAMSFAASVTSYYIHYVMKCFTSVIYMWTLYRYVSLRDYLDEFVPACASFDILLCFDVFARRQNKETFPYNMFLLFRIWRHLSTTSQL